MLTFCPPAFTRCTLARLPLLLPLAMLLSGCAPSAPETVPIGYWGDAPFEYFVSVIEADHPFVLDEAVGRQARPLIDSDHVTDIPSRFVADPFLFPAPEGGWFLFYEILNAANNRGEIGLSHSPDGRRWTYRGVVLREPFHLSYPLVFEWERKHYLLPETHKDGAVQLYIADAFPGGWRPIARLVEQPFADSTLFRHADRWWLLGSTTDNCTLHLYHSGQLDASGWVEHPMSPVIRNDRERARLGGRVFRLDDRLYRVAQDCAPRYGYQVRILEILSLTPERYEEREIAESPVLKPYMLPWADWGTHHFDPWFRQGTDDWLIAIDGYGPAQPQTVLDVHFGAAPWHHLAGITLRPNPVRVGEAFLLRLYWHRPPPEPLALFVHFVDDNGIAFQADHVPAERDVYHLTPVVPPHVPAGDYRLRVGLSPQGSRRRRPAHSAYPQRRSAVTLPVSLRVEAAE